MYLPQLHFIPLWKEMEGEDIDLLLQVGKNNKPEACHATGEDVSLLGSTEEVGYKRKPNSSTPLCAVQCASSVLPVLLPITRRWCISESMVILRNHQHHLNQKLKFSRMVWPVNQCSGRDTYAPGTKQLIMQEYLTLRTGKWNQTYNVKCQCTSKHL